jgi:pyrroloquinoline quinone (PQQ) biosynthesis protein C
LLIAMHGYMRASVPGMQMALDECRRRERSDRLAAALIPYFEHHIKEEVGHDEWLLKDVQLLGVSREQVLQRMPSPAVAALVGARYYWMLHHHPIAEMGYIAVLEGYPPTIEAVELMAELTGLPRAAFRTIERHAHLDPHHRDELNEMLDALPLDDEHHTILGTSALHTVRTVMTMLSEVQGRQPLRLAA